MEAALGDGRDVLIAVDGPSGPRHKVSPGAMWLSRAKDVQIRPFGASASPAFRLPRWDHLIVPLPHAHICAVLGEPLLAEQDIPETLDRLMLRARLATHPGVK